MEPLASWRTRPDTIPTSHPRYTQQKWWTTLFQAAQRRDLVATVANSARDLVRLNCQDKGVSSGWMKHPPHSATNSIVAPGDYQLGLRWWLGIPLLQDLPDNTPCPRCAATLDPFGDHLVCCKHNNFSARHGAVQECLLEFLRDAKQPVEREQGLDRENSRRVLKDRLRPADLLIRNWSAGKDVAVDVTVAHPLQRSESPWNMTRVSTFLKRREDAKILKYEDACRQEGWEFLPMAFSTWGSPGPQAYTLLHKILRRAAAATSAESRSEKISSLSNRLSLSLFRQVIALLQPIHLV